MTPLVSMFLLISVLVLLLGTYLWRLTSNRSIFLHTMFGTICMMLSAYHAATHSGLEWAVMLPFFTAMLFGGRAMGTWWRSRKDAELLLPARIMTTVAVLTLGASIGAYTWL